MRPLVFRIFTLILAMLLCSSAAYATIINVPDDFNTIQGAVNNADPGDTVLVQPGTYNESHIELTEAITLASLFLTTGDENYIASTIIDAEQNSKALYLNNVPAGGVVCGFTVQNGQYSDGAGVYIRNGAPTLDHLVLRNNVASHFGGAIYTAYADLTVSNCTIYDNEARDGGGIAIQESSNNNILLTHNVIHHNEADWGGGIRLLYGCNVEIEYLNLYDNTAVHCGGINCYGNGVVVSIDHATIHGNVCTDNNGGGMKMWGATEATITNTIFDANVPNNINNRSNRSEIFFAYSNFTEGEESIDNPHNATMTFGEGVIYENPLFVDPDNFDFELSANSPCVDTGDPNFPQDPDGSRTDMGYFYRHQNSPLEVAVTYPNGGESFEVGETVTITWTSQGGAGVDHSTISFSDDDGDTWTQVGQTDGNDFSFDWTVPNAPGSYLLRVTVLDHNDAEESDVCDASFAVSGMRLEQQCTAGWSFISIPLIQDDMSVEAVLLDDIQGQYGIYGFEPGVGHTNPVTLENAKGYFLGLHGSELLDVEGLPNDNASHTFDLALGWNVIGGPFAVPTPLADATVLVQTDEGEVSYTFAEAVDAEILSPIMYNFFDNQPEGEPDWPQGNHYLEHDTFQLWRGYWYMCMTEDVQLVVPNPEANNPAPPRDDMDDMPADNWYLQFLAANEETGDIARLGANPDATNEYDNRFDFPEPPAGPMENSVSLYFEHQGWGNQADGRFNRDIRPPMDRGDSQEWVLTVECGEPSEITLMWDEIFESTPWMNEYTLVDEVEDVEVDLHTDYIYMFNCEERRQFTIRVYSSLGVNDEAPALPDGFGLTSVYPNPFNAQTTISFQTRNNQFVNLAVFDMSGRKVADLFNGSASAGSHSVNWNAEFVQSGVYLVRLESANMTQTRKLILMK